MVDEPEPDTEPTPLDEAAPSPEPEPDTDADPMSSDPEPSPPIPATAEPAEGDEQGAPAAHVVAVPGVPEDDPDLIDHVPGPVGKPWTPEESDTPLDGWEPDDMNKKISSARTVRWTSVLAAVTVIALVGTGLVLLPSIAKSRAENHLEMYTLALTGLRGELDETQTSLATATDPATGVEELDALGTQLTVLAAKVSDLDAASQRDLPAVPPLTSSEPIDKLEPIRQRIEPLGTIATTIQRRIANLAHYRILMSGFLAVPELPVSADSATQAELRVQLAEAQAESAAVLSELPSDVSLDAHRTLARESNDRFAGWQVDYLEALRTEDAAAAEALIAELGGLTSKLDDELITPLRQIRGQTDTDLIDLARSIQEVIELANGDSTNP